MGNSAIAGNDYGAAVTIEVGTLIGNDEKGLLRQELIVYFAHRRFKVFSSFVLYHHLFFLIDAARRPLYSRYNARCGNRPIIVLSPASCIINRVISKAGKIVITQIIGVQLTLQETSQSTHPVGPAFTGATSNRIQR